MISVAPQAGDDYEVTVRSVNTTRHLVTVSDTVHAKLAPDASKEDLLTASFEFLLEREPNTSILSRFDLPLIGHYFPEFEREMGEKFTA